MPSVLPHTLSDSSHCTGRAIRLRYLSEASTERNGRDLQPAKPSSRGLARNIPGEDSNKAVLRIYPTVCGLRADLGQKIAGISDIGVRPNFCVNKLDFGFVIWRLRIGRPYLNSSGRRRKLF